MNKKVGLLGAGYILDAHAKALVAIPGIDLLAVCDISRSRAKQAAAKFGIPHVLNSIEELAASDCEVVHVLLPPALHIDAASALVDAGKSVFLEKPMGLDSERCTALCDRAAAKGVTVGVNHNFLFAPQYEALRERVKAGEIGRIDHLSVNWHFSLPLLHFGPFDNWMLSAPANIIFELGSHLSSLVIDLLGVPKVISAVAGNPIDLPAGLRIYRHWNIIGAVGNATATISISIADGQPDRILRVRGRGGSSQLDFGRDIGWSDGGGSADPMFESYEIAKAAGSALRKQAKHDLLRRLKSALAKRPTANPFEESIYRSIRAFYARGTLPVNSRHDGRFGADVIRLCESIVETAKVGAPSQRGITVSVPQAVVKPTVLVVGGTGFIGRRLVRMLAMKGHAVRVLTRNLNAAAIELRDLPVELQVGSHGDPECAKKALDGVGTVYHLAKCEGKRWQDYLDNDVAPTRVLAQAAVQAGVKRFIYTGTIACYYAGNRKETIDNRTRLDTSMTSRSYYSRSKAMCEELLQEMRRERGLPLVIIRPGIVIGPGSPPAHPGIGRFASETKVDFWGDGTNQLPLVVVDDVADALVRAFDAPNIIGEGLLVTGPPLLTAREYVDALSAYTSTKIYAHSRSPFRNWMSDLVKEFAKNVIRHPNRRWPTLRDWQCRSNLAHYDSRMTEEALGWRPVSDRETLVLRGIKSAVDEFFR